MKSPLTLALGLVGSIVAEPVPWSRSSGRNLFSRAEANSILASRSISSSPAFFVTTNYDYLVVGGGTAGLALATRLSESGKYTVGVLEAGTSGLGVPIIDIPGDFRLDIGTIYDWNYTTVPGSGANAGVPPSSWSRGKVLGGSSVLSSMDWDRATTVEYDAWEKLGNKGWVSQHPQERKTKYRSSRTICRTGNPCTIT
jgi:hypothetical protein